MITLGKYELRETIGEGAFGIVYKAFDPTIEVDRAIKVLKRDLISDVQFLLRFRREAALAARLDHPNIVPVYTLEEFEGQYFLVMKYMPNKSLKDLLVKEGRLPLSRTAEVLSQVAAGLDYAHSMGIVHRDIKPANILLEANGAARLGDFGFARAQSSEDSSSGKSLRDLVGTSAYIAPEIWDDQPATPASDQYSLACVTYEMLTGEKLFSASNPASLVKKVLAGPQFPDKWPQGTPSEVTSIFSRALAQDPAGRYGSAGEFAAAFKQPGGTDRSARVLGDAKAEPGSQPAQQLELEARAAENTPKMQSELAVKPPLPEPAQVEGLVRVELASKPSSPTRQEESLSDYHEKPFWRKPAVLYITVPLILILGAFFINQLTSRMAAPTPAATPPSAKAISQANTPSLIAPTDTTAPQTSIPSAEVSSTPTFRPWHTPTPSLTPAPNLAGLPTVAGTFRPSFSGQLAAKFVKLGEYSNSNALYSPNGQYLVIQTGHDDLETISIFDAGGKVSFGTFNLPAALHPQIHSISPDGRQLVVLQNGDSQTYADNKILVYTLPGSKVTRQYDGYLAAYSPDGRFFITAQKGDKSLIKIWEMPKNDLLLEKSIDNGNGEDGVVWDFTFSQDSLRLAISTVLVNDQVSLVTIMDMSTGQESFSTKEYKGPAVRLQFSTDNQVLFILYKYYYAQLWDLSQRKLLRSFSGNSSIWNGSELSPTNSLVLVPSTEQANSQGNTFLIYDYQTDKILCQLNGIGNAEFTPNGEQLISTSYRSSSNVTVWGPKTCKTEKYFPQYTNYQVIQEQKLVLMKNSQSMDAYSLPDLTKQGTLPFSYDSFYPAPDGSSGFSVYYDGFARKLLLWGQP